MTMIRSCTCCSRWSRTVLVAVSLLVSITITTTNAGTRKLTTITRTGIFTTNTRTTTNKRFNTLCFVSDTNYYKKYNNNKKAIRPEDLLLRYMSTSSKDTSNHNNNKYNDNTKTNKNIFTKIFSSLSWGGKGKQGENGGGGSTTQSKTTTSAAAAAIEQQKKLILKAIQNTENGKIATIDEQRTVLQLVRQLELLAPPPSNILQSTTTALTNLNGTWYLQYTSPSTIQEKEKEEDEEEEKEEDNNNWVPINPTEGSSNIETSDPTKFQARGTVSAAGIVVDTANKLTTQTIDVGTNYVTNTVQVSSDISIIVGGTFRPSDTVPNRVLVAFEIAKIVYQNTITLLDLSFVFGIIALIRNSRDNGWLETTYLDSSLRIGRGNKGTLFILTKQSNPY